MEAKSTDTAPKREGISRWRSASTDKGSIGAYGKDVQEKLKKKNKEKQLDFSKGGANGRRSQRQDFKEKGLSLDSLIF